MNSASEVKRFSVDAVGMDNARIFLEKFCEDPRPSIVMDEIVSNIVRCSGASYFDVGIELNEHGLKLTFTDDGSPFDPTRQIGEPDVKAKLEDRKIGGLGMFMVKRMSKSVTYNRVENLNVLVVVM